MSGKISTDLLFLGLTRPPLLFGVSYKFAALNGIIALLAFIITSNFFYLLVLLPGLHGLAWLITLKEPLVIELFIVKNSKCNICRNRMSFQGVNSYDCY